MSRIRALLLGALVMAWAGPGPAQGAQLAAPPGAESAVPDALAAESGGEAAPGPVEETVRGPAPANEIERAWLLPAATLSERVIHVRRASFNYGVWNLDPAARALLAGGGDLVAGPVERGRAAVQVAPHLPMARIELARAIWLHENSPIVALRNAWSSALAIPRHALASLWFAGSGAAMLALALVAGALLCIAVAGALAAPHAAHDLADLISRSTPAFARAAILGALLLVPFALGEGALGLALLLLAIGCAYGPARQRAVLALAAAALLLGAFPVAQWAGTLITALERDPVASSAFSMANGSSLRSDAVRLAAAADSDPLAAQALARLARRELRLAEADARYQQLLERRPDDWVVVNNAANVRLELGHMAAALHLYRRAAELRESAVVFYNLAQSYGRSFEVEELAVTLEHAQALDGDLMADLAQLQSGDLSGFVVDLPLPAHWLWQRLDGPGPGEALAARMRVAAAPGRLGSSAAALAGGLAGAVLLGSLVGSNIRRARWCSRCGCRQCGRCDPESGGRTVCGDCNRLFYEHEDTHKARRLERINALRERERRIERWVAAVSLLVPGVAGFLARRPSLSFAACFSLSLAAAAVIWRNGAVPDPGLAGAAAPFLFLHLAGLCAVVYATSVGAALAARRRL